MFFQNIFPYALESWRPILKKVDDDERVNMYWVPLANHLQYTMFHQVCRPCNLYCETAIISTILLQMLRNSEGLHIMVHEESSKVSGGF